MTFVNKAASTELESALFFKTFINDIPIAWNEYECDKVEEWTMDEFLIKNDLDKIDKYVEETFNTFVEYCKEKLNILLEGEN